MPTKTKPKAGKKAAAVAPKSKGTKAKPKPSGGKAPKVDRPAGSDEPAIPAPKPSSRLFRDRIVAEGVEAPDQILANPLNWRRHPKHQADALEDWREHAQPFRYRELVDALTGKPTGRPAPGSQPEESR